MIARRRLRGWAVLVLGVALAGCSAGTMPAVHSESERLELARRAMARRDYTVSIEMLKAYVATATWTRPSTGSA